MENSIAKLATASLNDRVYAEFSNAWTASKENLAATAISLKIPYEHAAARSYAFNVLPAEDARTADLVWAYAAMVKDPKAETIEEARDKTTPREPLAWKEFISETRQAFDQMRDEGSLSKASLGSSFYGAAGLSQSIERDGILSARPDVQMRFMKEAAPCLENIALALHRSGDDRRAKSLLGLASSAVAFVNANEHERQRAAESVER